MAKTATTKPAATETHGCACGCGEPVTRLFKQGHDQRLVSNLASDLVYMDVWDGKCMGILKGAIVRGDQQEKINKVTEYVRAKISDGLAAKVYSAAMRAWDLQKTRDARESKREEARKAKAAAAASKPKRASKANAAASSEEAKAAAEPKLITKAAKGMADVDAEEARLEAEERGTNDGTGPGGPRYARGVGIRVLIGKRKRNAKVHGMNQSGKVTAITVTTNGKETVIDDPERFSILS